ncbi:MAG: cyclic nucleotide-binding domain-containing protein [Gemmatimonadota bacterium]|jgi:CRP-like cAMP-binding protein
MGIRSLGKRYGSGESIVSQGAVGNCMYVIQEGQAEVYREENGRDIRMAVLKEGDFFGEMSIFDHEVRAATVRALGDVRVLTIDKKTFMRRIQKDPSLAFDIVRTMSQRIRQLNSDLAEMRARESVE